MKGKKQRDKMKAMNRFQENLHQEGETIEEDKIKWGTPLMEKGEREWLKRAVVKGDRGLLQKSRVAILNSQNASSEALKLGARVAEIVQEAGFVVTTSTTKSYRAVFEACIQKKIPTIVVTDRSLNELKEFWETHPEMLFVSPFEKGVPYQISNQVRDEIIKSTADILIGIEITEGGKMESLIRKSKLQNHPVFVARFMASTHPSLANSRLIQEGFPSFTPDITLQELQHQLRNIKRTPWPFGPKKELGQFFTPAQVVDFMYETISAYIGKPIPKDWKILDPACGEGVFLKRASEKSIAPDENLYGMEIDPELTCVWEQSGIRNRLNLFITDGLIDHPEVGIQEESFDIVIGNPPFGGTGLKDILRFLPEETNRKTGRNKEMLFGAQEKETEEAEVMAEKGTGYKMKEPLTTREKRYIIHLLLALEHYDSLKKAPVNLGEELDAEVETEFFGKVKRAPKIRTADNKIRTNAMKRMLGELDRGINQMEKLIQKRKPLQDWIRRVASFPIEVLFVERFIRLAKPGGFIAVIVPDGILANYQLQFLRDWIEGKARWLAIVSLPRETFKASGITAKTSILFLRKLLPDEKPAMKEKIFMAKVDFVGVNSDGKNELPELLPHFAKLSKSGRRRVVHNSPIIFRVTNEATQ